MFELMYEHNGIGLAANQVDLPIQLFVIDPTGERGSSEQQVLINPVIQSAKGSAEAEEGCLSIPGVYANVTRPKSVQVMSFDLQGNEYNARVEGLLGRVIQHEYDHLHGNLFIDRVNEASLKQLDDELEAFEIEFRALRTDGKIDSDEVIQKRLAEFEQKYC